MLHQDTHLENIFFHESYPGGCAFIDFGNVGFGHALSDVTFFLATSVRRVRVMVMVRVMVRVRVLRPRAVGR